MQDARARFSRIQLTSLLLMVSVLGFLFAVQVRSQATAERYLSGQDNVSLGLLITGLSQSNQRLSDARADLLQQVQRLQQERASGGNPAGSIQQELGNLELADGSVPAHGPGLVLTVSFALHDYEIEDLANALRQSGAEAIDLNGHRLTARSVIGEKGGRGSVDGEEISTPYRVSVIGDPARLAAGAESLSASLQARGAVTVDQQADVRITSTVPEHPQVYSTYGG